MQVERINEPEIFENARFIRLYPSGFALVDEEDYTSLIQHRWKIIKSKTMQYAGRKYRKDGKVVYVRMHREIAQAKPGEDVHHKNSNTFDNRKQNFQLLDPVRHAKIKRDPLI